MSTMQNSNLIAAAVGAAIGVISVATVFIYNKVLERQQRAAMKTNIDRVNRKVSELQAELEELRAQQANLQKNRSKKRFIRRQVYSNENTYTGTEEVDLDTFSTAGTDIGDDEFFDCSDDEGEIDLGNWTNEGIVNQKTELLKLDQESEDKFQFFVHYQKVKNLLQENPNDVEIVWRFSRACYNCSIQSDDYDKQKEYIFEGCEICEKILHIRDGNLYKWYAILLGLKSKYLPTKGKIEYGCRFKEYVEKGLELCPDDSLLHHLLGRFKYEVSELSWLERKVAATLFAEVPSGTYQDAIPHFETAEKLAPKPHHENRLFLGKSYIAIGNYKEGVSWLRKIRECPSDSDEDAEIHEEARQLAERYANYNA
ncbi:regulator of microtubule dynamics protein 1-like [Phymastichus coffea]|uniref:regulator of microtubule dynamics protein 1-like n=1 Tax=Phymastichus coffea TaxID=108790 RepID=UPI00273A99B5|nr:regulator of microtubule dynamics protein 1-like [Phymastichus coffea]XP_058801973.1 regulator of microtubule dynamics protein 1-like [Phymastichus coffea]XP_058801974.1 regulator of microtubule dynamics protein 1-like [Phymastichus coffea]